MEKVIYPPGSVAMVKCDDGEWRRGIAYIRHDDRRWFVPINGMSKGIHSEVRPLLTLDPNNGQQMDRLAFLCDTSGRRMAAAVEAMLPKPIPTKPPEPTEDGAVAKTRDGKFYERVDGAWHYNGDTEYVGRSYADLDVVAVYLPRSEGER